MPLRTRVATEDDIDPIVALTAAHRARLAAWAPRWWRPSAAADQLHRLWLRHLVENDRTTVRVVDDTGAVIGCAVSMPQRDQWVVDDVALVADDRWADAGTTLLTGIDERPALTCVPTEHTARVTASQAAGLDHVSSYWIRTTDEITEEPSSTRHPSEPPGRLEGAAAPPHTFGGPLDPAADGALVVTDGTGGLAVGTPSIAPPPVYDPGGTVCVVDRVSGRHRADLLRSTVAAAAGRGDVLLNVVAASSDTELHDLLSAAGFERTVDVYRWP
jgi:hypothetical protein